MSLASQLIKRFYVFKFLLSYILPVGENMCRSTVSLESVPKDPTIHKLRKNFLIYFTEGLQKTKTFKFNYHTCKPNGNSKSKFFAKL